ncbi:hypothetical protein B9Z65_8473 [Elsinoe australis]|uniref:NAD(P)-binding protein n=1 Tax=Elsinoe australis TaxID=40998 RepID=A0A2P7YDW3_9PEZI|nr:hypothetical protein B9Z65_8473 [Elsinoe australis]
MDTANALLTNLSTKLEKLYPKTTAASTTLTTPLTTIGLLTTTYLAYNATSFIYQYLRPSSLPKYHHGQPYTTWALITGASDGIGAGFAEALLSRGFHVVLHGRNPTKLAGVKQRLASQFPKAQILTVVADAGSPSADIASIVTAVSTLPLTVLINNVGGVPFGEPYNTLEDAEASTVDALINLNLRFPTQLTKALLPILQKNEPSLVVNIGSGAGEMGLPYLGVYCGSKAFNLRWNQAMKAEMMALGKKVEMLGILVGNVRSGGNKIGEGFFTCSSLTMANAALDRVGCGRSSVWGWWRHGLQFGFIGSIPEGMRLGAASGMMAERKRQHVEMQSNKVGTEDAMKG